MLICNMMNVSTEERLAFTMKRIEENPSNYSAWHFRCELINKTITETNAESVLKEGGSALLHSCVELDLNLNGLYTECDDQSAWYYLRSLVYLIVKFVKSGVLAKEKGVELISNELEALVELEEAAPDCIYLKSSTCYTRSNGLFLEQTHDTKSLSPRCPPFRPCPLSPFACTTSWT